MCWELYTYHLEPSHKPHNVGTTVCILQNRTEAQRGEVTCLRLPSSSGLYLDGLPLSPGLPDFGSIASTASQLHGWRKLWRTQHNAASSMKRSLVTSWSQPLCHLLAHMNFERHWELLSHPAAFHDLSCAEFSNSWLPGLLIHIPLHTCNYTSSSGIVSLSFFPFKT